MPTIHKYACDACRRRKIRCDKTQPCIGCTSALISCTFLAPSQPKGRHGQTANVISELRASQVRNIQGSISDRPNLNRAILPVRSNTRTSGLITVETIKACVEFYFSQFHSSVPIIEDDILQFDGDLLETDNDTYCLLLSFCAFIILQTGVVHGSKSTADNSLLLADIRYGKMLLYEALEARRDTRPIVLPSVRTVITSFLLYGCYRFLNDQNKTWFFLREATSLYVSGTSDGDISSDLSHSPISNQIYWLLLSTERAYSIRKHRPLTMLISASSPNFESLSLRLRTSGFAQLVELYEPFDEVFIGSWNGTSNSCSTNQVISIETRLQQAVSVSMDLSEVQMADLLVSQQWLRMIVWQLCTQLGYLSSTAKHESLTFWYPIIIARDLMISTWDISEYSMQIHGIGLVEKLFDICYQLIDVITYTSSIDLVALVGETSPKEYLAYIVSLIRKLRGGEERFIPLIETKLEQSSLNLMEALSKPLPMPLLSFPPSTPPDSLSVKSGDDTKDNLF